MKAVIHTNPSYELVAQTNRTRVGIELKFLSYVKTARRPEMQTRWTATLSREELHALRSLLDAELNGS